MSQVSFTTLQLLLLHAKSIGWWYEE
jgi:hypothetical protein